MSDEIELPQETREYVDLGFRVDGAVPASGVEAALLPTGTRPLVTDWANAELVGGSWKIFIGTDLPLGLYDIWARHTDNPEKTVRVKRRIIRII